MKGGGGTGSQGLKSRGRMLHMPCRRCGSPSYHKKKSKCSSCGYGRSSKLRSYSWQKK